MSGARDAARLVAFVLPLGLDTLALAAALGASRPSPRERRRLTLLFVAFEAGMPVVGLALGAPLAGVLSGAAHVVAGLALAAVGVWMLASASGEAEEAEERRARSFVTARGWAAAGLGLAISLDELAVGFGLGLARLPVAGLVLAIAVQALVATQVGLRLGARLSEGAREAAERVAAVALVALGAALLLGAL